MRALLRDGSDNQLNWLDPMQSLYYDKADVYIRVGSSSNTRAGGSGSGRARISQRSSRLSVENRATSRVQLSPR